MKALLDNVLQEVAADLVQHGFDDQFLHRSVARMKTLAVETEDDRCQYLSGYLRLIDYLIDHAPAEMVETIEAQRHAIHAHFNRMYGRPDTPYLTTNRIVSELLEGLKSGRTPEEMVARALAALDNVAFLEGADDAVKMWGILRIRALERACNWLAQDEHEGPVEKTLVVVVEQIEKAAKEGWLSTAFILKMAQTIKEPADAPAPARQIIASMLMLVLGLGLMFRSEAAPAFEPLRDRILGLLADDAPLPPPATIASSCDAILDKLKATLEREGFSEYVFSEATAALRALSPVTADDHEAIQAAALRTFDITVPYAPPEAAQTFLAARSNIESQIEAIASNATPQLLTPEELHAAGQATLQKLKAELETGALPGPAFMKAMGMLQALGRHVREGDEDSLKILVTTMAELPRVFLPYAPENTELPFREIIAMTEMMPGALDLSSDNPAGAVVFEQTFNEQMARIGHAVDPTAMSAEFAAIAHIRQFVDLVPSFNARLMRLRQVIDEETKDGAEIKRLASRFDQYAKVINFAITEEQFLRYQRGALRGVALELRQFERRHHLMMVRPAFPVDPVTADPNVVFFSGSDQVASVLDQACRTLGIGVAAVRGLDNPTHARWQQLRQSGIAVFDYSAYDPLRADPAGAVPRAREAEADLLRAAGPVARVAYETGWAYVTGTPMVIVARQGQTIPFDVDIAPVLLQDDGDDAERLVAAIQAALYGIPRGGLGNCLDVTVAELRKRHGNHANPRVRALLDSVADLRDATHVRLTLRAILDRLDGENSLLVLPAFPGSYPPDGRHRLFHVAAFRDWGKVAQTETRSACERAMVSYHIGYERLNPDVLRAIWSDLCEASFVVADITNLNPNAVLELAMAQALGRRTLILTQNREPHAHFPAVQKVRTHLYDPNERRADLARLLDSFLAGTV